jgi:DNA-binding FrmR family transcriptional regulator
MIKKKQCCDKKHLDHSPEMPRLRKIEGQIKGIQKMVTEQRYCVDILDQLSAVKAAINSLQANVLESHLNGCVREAFALKKEKDIKEKIDELKKIFRKY